MLKLSELCCRVKGRVWVALTFHIQVDFVAGHTALQVGGPAEVLAVRGLGNPLQDERLVGDDDAAGGVKLLVLCGKINIIQLVVIVGVEVLLACWFNCVGKGRLKFI